jgi:hypothetical protein
MAAGARRTRGEAAIRLPERLGRYPAARALFAFVALELAHPRPDEPRVLGVAAALYTYWALAGMAVYGREPWTRGGEGFAAAFGLLARIAPLAKRDDRIVVRWPLTGLGGAERLPGTLAVIAVLLGSTSFDGFSRTTIWQDLLADVRAGLVDAPTWRVELTTSAVYLGGLVAFVAAVAAAYLVAVTLARRLVRSPQSLVPEFVLSLVPIAAAYVAHYFRATVGPVPHPARVRSSRPRLGSIRDRRLLSQPRRRLTGDRLVRPGGGARHRARRRPRHCARSRGRPLRTSRGRSTLSYPMLALMVLFTVRACDSSLRVDRDPSRTAGSSVDRELRSLAVTGSSLLSGCGAERAEDRAAADHRRTSAREAV